jgi:Transposase
MAPSGGPFAAASARLARLPTATPLSFARASAARVRLLMSVRFVACVRTMSGTRATRECRTYGTTTDGLLALLEQLSASGCSVVAMEATGVYWLPVWKMPSDGDFKLVLANAAHIKAVPGRTTDLKDAMWIADLAPRTA